MSPKTRPRKIASSPRAVDVLHAVESAVGREEAERANCVGRRVRSEEVCEALRHEHPGGDRAPEANESRWSPLAQEVPGRSARGAAAIAVERAVEERGLPELPLDGEDELSIRNDGEESSTILSAESLGRRCPQLGQCPRTPREYGRIDSCFPAHSGSTHRNRRKPSWGSAQWKDASSGSRRRAGRGPGRVKIARKAGAGGPGPRQRSCSAHRRGSKPTGAGRARGGALPAMATPRARPAGGAVRERGDIVRATGLRGAWRGRSNKNPTSRGYASRVV